MTVWLAIANYNNMTTRTSYIHDGDAAGKALILREGLRLFARKGLSATSIRDIAKATGLSNPALYKHFKTKDELALVLFERLYRAHLLHLTHTVEQEPGFPGKFRAFVQGRLRAYDENPDATMFATDNLAALWPLMPKTLKARTILSLLRDIVQAGRSEGLVAADIDIGLQLSLIVGALDHVTRQIFFQGLPGPALQYLDGIEKIVRKGLA